MLTQLRFAQYKSFGDPPPIPLKKLTIFIGKNNSGKTAAIRMPLLLTEALSDTSRTSIEPSLLLGIRGLRYGANVLDLIRGHDIHGAMSLGISLITEVGEQGIDVSFQSRQSLDVANSFFPSSFSSTQTGKFSWDPGGSKNSAISYGPEIECFDGVIPRFYNEALSSATALIRRDAAANLASMMHLSALRTPIQPLYEQRTFIDAKSVDGSDVPYLIRENADLLNAISEWYKENMDTEGISISAEIAAFQMRLQSQGGGSENLSDVGQGIQQVLSVIAYSKALQLGTNGVKTLLVEEPELHLHPSAHAAVGDLFVNAVKGARDNQVIVETHSENLILRIRRRVATGELSPSDVNIIYFDNRSGETSPHEIQIRPDGSVSQWPQGIFSEDLTEVREISKASRQ